MPTSAQRRRRKRPDNCSHHLGCWNARNALPSEPRVTHVRIVVFFPAVQANISTCATAISSSSGAMESRSPMSRTPELRHLFHRQLVGVAMQRGYKPGWAAHQYKSKFGHWPPHSNVEPMVPKPEVTSWVRSRQIAYAKAMQKAG